MLKLKYYQIIIYYMFQCPKCDSKFEEERRLKIHYKTHENKETKNRTRKQKGMPDFEKPDFTQVM